MSGSRSVMMAGRWPNVWRLKLLFALMLCTIFVAASTGLIMARCRNYVRGEGSLRETSPLVMEEMEFDPYVHSDRGKRKVVSVGAKGNKRPRRSGRPASGIVFRSPQRVGDTDRHAAERSDLRQGYHVAGENSSPRFGDVGSEFYYLGKTGKKRTVKRSDCSFHLAPIATSLLKGIVLDGDKAEVKDEDMETLLGTMDMAACLFLAGYDKLKDDVQNVETDVNPHDELGCMRAAWGVDKRKLEVMTNKYQNAADENAALVTAMTNLEGELAKVTAYAKQCQGVARKAQKAYTMACAEYAALDEKYHLLKKAIEGEEQGRGMRVMLRSARHTASTSAAPKDKHVLTDV